MSTSKTRKNQYLNPGVSQATASTASRKGNPGASVNKSKYGGTGTMYASSRSRTNILSSAGKRSVTHGEKTVAKPPVQVLDEAGNDVTPLPLLHSDPSAVKKNQGNILADSSAGTPTDLMSQASIYNTGNVTASTFGGGPFTRSVFSASQGTASDSMIGEDITEPSQDMSSAWAEIRHKREEVKETLTDADLEKVVNLTLTETETIWLLDMPGTSVSNEAEEAASIKKRNEEYQELQKNRVGNDRYMERGMNTFNEPAKYKTVQTSKISCVDTGIMATTWDMYDTFEQRDQEIRAKEKEDDEEGTISRPSSPKETEEGKGDSKPQSGEQTGLVREESRATMASSMAGSESVFASRETGVSSIPSELSAVEEDRIFKSENFQRDLFIMERVVNLNTYQPKQALYRNFTIIPDVDREITELGDKQVSMVSDMGPNFDRLWSYSCKLTSGRNISCMSWNKLNPDLVAVGYGEFEFSDQKSGLICCWCLKNPDYPERVYACKEGVTAIDFSKAYPNLLAVGMYDGGVAIYNVASMKDEPIIDNFHTPGKHTAPVWHIKWIEKERGSGEETSEVVVSISTDGRVTQWSIRKGFECYDIMKLKRTPTKFGGKKEKKGEAFISRHAGGMCFDFHPKEANIYVAGTEEGHIHKCSCSYNEQYLETYNGHTGPVYKIEWSPFVNDIFLSCSADWSIRLWHQERTQPVLNFFSSTKSVYDVVWSPKSSTVFACVNEGAVEVWDLSVSTLDPIITNNPTSGAKKTAVSFSKNSDCILVGDSKGELTVYQLRSMADPPANQEEALRNVIKASLASQLQQDLKKKEEEAKELEQEVDEEI
ncbi:dynein axonemal intermediate chain 4-like isoform X4 [Ostrea edulis]|uniref:dynein axonemal intermediate chain 4-like isoform X4 n=1 Tax=Ostrea edulis TaxID=37623 RepID=UPI002094CE5A|nr:dynein axonemal intermediate chain 4-like isoform X4 [Ostrea edulis]